MKESYRIELKLTLTDSLEKELIAFLNSREGGIIYIGIDDNGVPQGVHNSDAVQLQSKHSVNSVLFHEELASCFESFSKTFGEL
jgi:predicted HTH transcriptional regulator